MRRFAVGQRAAFVGLAGRVLLGRAFRAGEHAVVVHGRQVFAEPAVVHELGLDGRGVDALVVKELLDVFGDLEEE